MKIFKNILEISEKYKGFIVDVWGVLHASGVPYPGVIDSLNTMKAKDKKILLLSNAPRRASVVEDFLAERVGIHRGKHFDEILSSGEVFFRKIESSPDVKKVFYIGLEKDLSVTKSHKIQLVKNMEDADFAVATSPIPNYMEVLPSLKKLGKKLYCLNPDIYVTKSDGGKEECAGFIARKYSAIGGEVVYFGKPHSLVYEEAMKFFSPLPKEEIIAVGDGMETDILGANNFKIKSALCLSGLPSVELNKGYALSSFLEMHVEEKPDFVINSL